MLIYYVTIMLMNINIVGGGDEMNKLEIALKLLRLLNERRCVDSRIVADELEVSLRTAQRYLLELSGLPCVSTDEKTHTYCLNSEYPLKEALRKDVNPEDLHLAIQKGVQAALALKEITCTVCGNVMKNIQ
jgi:predicted DNA-binding transcriptional regulator YafY